MPERSASRIVAKLERASESNGFSTVRFVIESHSASGAATRLGILQADDALHVALSAYGLSLPEMLIFLDQVASLYSTRPAFQELRDNESTETWVSDLRRLSEEAAMYRRLLQHSPS